MKTVFIVGLVGAYYTIMNCKHLLVKTENYYPRVGEMALNKKEQGETQKEFKKGLTVIKARVNEIEDIGNNGKKWWH